jgi:hypothetical protein
MGIAQEIIRIFSNGQTSQRDPIRTQENRLITLTRIDSLFYVADNLGAFHRVDLNNKTVDQILRIDGKEYNLSTFSGSFAGLAKENRKVILFSKAYELVQKNKNTEDISEILKEESIFKFLFEYVFGDPPNTQQIDHNKNYERYDRERIKHKFALRQKNNLTSTMIDDIKKDYNEYDDRAIKNNLAFLQKNNLNFTMTAVKDFNENAKVYFYQACRNCIESLKDLNIDDDSYYDKLNVAFETLLIIARKLKTFQKVQSDLSKSS